MSSTRHVSSGSSRRQNGLASDPVYAAAQGIQGTIATKKAGILASARARSLVFFLQALSLPELAGRPNPGGLQKWVREFLSQYSDRVGTPSMHAFGMKPGQIYKADQVRRIRDELLPHSRDIELRFPLLGDLVWTFDDDEVPVKNGRSSYPASDLVAECLNLAKAGLTDFIVSLCTDPRLLILAPGEKSDDALADEHTVAQEWAGTDQHEFKPAGLGYFRDVVGALFEFQRRFAERQAESFATTSIARKVFDTLDAGLRLRRIVLVNGIEGIGKSEASRAWAAQHLGEARYVDLTGINHKTAFFRSIARALGLPSSESLNTAQLQTRVEAMLQRSGLMLLVDEAHYALPQSERSEAPPEIVNWITTALCNRGVAVGLVTTEQFVTTMQRVEKKTGWNSGQFMRRIKRVVQLPERPEQSDLDAVARKLQPASSESFYKLVVGFAGAQKRHHLDALADVIKEAVELARLAGRNLPTFADAKAAIDGVLVPSVMAKQAIFSEVKKQRPPKPRRETVEPGSVSDDAEEPSVNRLAGARAPEMAHT